MINTFGVSPAFYISQMTNRFTIDEVCKSLSIISKLGFQCYQPEVFYEENLSDWIRGAALVQSEGNTLGLKASQFVAHFMMHYFAGEELVSDKGVQEIENALHIAKQFEGCEQITVPVAPYEGIEKLYPQVKSDLKKRLIDKLYRIFEKVERENLKMALEIQPGALISIKNDFTSICEQFGSVNIGLNLDTGHAHVSSEDVANLPLQFRGRIFGTHICDNFGRENLSLKPGSGSLPWNSIIGNLLNSGYKGSLDIEINCKPEALETEYRAGKDYLEAVLGEMMKVK